MTHEQIHPEPSWRRLYRNPRRGWIAGVANATRLLDELPEALEVELARLHAKPVALAVRLEPVAQRLAQLPDEGLDDVARTCGWLLAPELVDEPLHRNRLVCVQQQQCQQRARASTESKRLPGVIQHFE